MDIGYIKNNSKIISKAMLGLSTFMVICLVFKGICFLTSASKIERQLAEVASASVCDSNGLESALASSKKKADGLKEKNLFAPPPPKQHPVKQVTGIMGAEVLINGKWYKAGNSVGDAKIVSVEPTQVKIAWDGSEKYFAPIAAANSHANTNNKPAEVKRNHKARKRETRRAEKQTQEPIQQADNDPLVWMGIKLSETARARMLEMWNKASDEEKEEAKRRWNSMSEEEKQKQVARFEAHG